MNEAASPPIMSEAKDAAAVSQSEPVKQAEVRGGSSRRVPVVALEEWRTETEGSQPVAKEHTRKKEEPLMGNTAAIPRAEDVSTKQQRIAELARQMRGKALTSLSHHIDGAWLLEAWRRTRKDGAKGVDGQSAQQYAENLQGNLADLLDRAKSGSYQAPPVKRVHIPKGDGKSTRPIGIPTLEDKVLQRAIVMALEPVYEADFKESSFGFRPGKSAHDALETLWKQSMGTRRERPVQWVLDVDIKSYFDTLDHTHLRQMLDKRIRDGVIRRLIDKWLKAGVMEQGTLSYQDEGTPQGGVISPLLSNIYLHEVLDTWFEHEVQPRMSGRAYLVRYADDFVIGFEHEEDARRVMAVLPKRFERYGLKLHPEKTRLVEFKPQPARNRKPGKEDNNNTNDPQPPHSQERPPKSFDFLGFTHYWSHSRQGNPIVKRRTASNRQTRALKALRDWMRHHRHDPVKEQWRTLMSKVRGHAAYYGIPGNSRGIGSYSHQAQNEWFKWLNRRGGQKPLTWEKYAGWLKGIFHWSAPKIRTRSQRA
jgi:RNA-directed DNA polymerase